MYRGFLKYDGVEVINVARTMAYIRAGFGTPGVAFDDTVPIDGVPEALGQSYKTPVLDAAPWYDVERPETYGFAGILPMDITGLPGTTAVRDLTQNIADGAVAGARRRASRTVAVTALLVGDSAASAYAGLDWLTTILLRICNPFPTDAPVLEGFVVKPDDSTGLEDLNAEMITTTVADDDPGWAAYGGTYNAGTFSVPSPTPPGSGVSTDGGDPAGVGGSGPDLDGGSLDGDVPLDGGAPDGDPGGDLDGGTPEDPGAGDMDGGTVTDDNSPDAGSVEDSDGGDLGTLASSLTAYAAAPVPMGCRSYVEVTWTITPTGSGPARVQFGAVDDLGRELDRVTDVEVITEETTLAWKVYSPSWDEWYPAIWVASPGAEVHATVKRYPLLDPAACLSAIKRNIYGLECIAGPTVTSETTDDCDNKLLTVEWTWDGGNPYRYGDLTDVVNGLPVESNAAPVSKADGVAVSFPGTITNSTLNCDPPDTTPATCAYDPAGAWFAAPPIAPAIADTTKVNHASVKRRLISIDPGVFPDHGVVSFSWVFENDSTAKHSVRVRLWQQDDPDFGTHDECSFVSEFWVAYMAPDALFFINGLGDEVNVICGGQVVPAGGVMRGPYYGAFEPPSIVCGGRYFITVDVGATEGALVVDLAMALREG